MTAKAGFHLNTFMSYDEYAKERDALITPCSKRRIANHVAERFNERFNISCVYGDWARYSHEAATRTNCEKVGTNHKAVLLRREIAGGPVILVYSRKIKCVVTVLTEPMVSGYIEQKAREDRAQDRNAARKRRLKAGTQRTKGRFHR